MSSVLVTGVALLALAQGCFGAQTWNLQPAYSEVNPGNSVVLNCKVYNKQGTCAWQKGNKPQGMFTGKYEWSGDRESGDCSIRIMDAGVIDNGAWECQITASSFTADDALSSKIAQLFVRVAPAPPMFEVDTVKGGDMSNFTVKEDQPAISKCISRYGNPAANIKWFLDSDELPSESYSQSNTSEPEQPKTWQAVSVLSHKFLQDDHNKSLRCVAVHQAYPTMSAEVNATINVQYSPTVTIQGTPTDDVEEGVDAVVLGCVADANPTANIVWRRLGDVDVFSFQEMVEFNPVTRKHSATYTCEAHNSVGASDPISTKIDVKYPPSILQVGPTPTMTIGLHNSTSLDCQAEGNPSPQYTWIQTVPNSDEQIVRGHNATLLIDSVSYEHQGQYVCVASNTIKGEEKQVASDAFRIEVVGRPQVLEYAVDHNIEVKKGNDALIAIVFCSDPQPSSTSWEWGSLRLDAGAERGRYVAETLPQGGHDNCYNARLRVHHADFEDAREYILVVENNQGADRYAVGLQVTEPVSMTKVIGIVVACLILLVCLIFIVLYACKAKKCCFSQSGDFKSTELESDKSDIENQNGGFEIDNKNGSTKVMPSDEKEQQANEKS